MNIWCIRVGWPPPSSCTPEKKAERIVEDQGGRQRIKDGVLSKLGDEELAYYQEAMKGGPERGWRRRSAGCAWQSRRKVYNWMKQTTMIRCRIWWHAVKVVCEHSKTEWRLHFSFLLLDPFVPSSLSLWQPSLPSLTWATGIPWCVLLAHSRRTMDLPTSIVPGFG